MPLFDTQRPRVQSGRTVMSRDPRQRAIKVWTAANERMIAAARAAAGDNPALNAQLDEAIAEIERDQDNP